MGKVVDQVGFLIGTSKHPRIPLDLLPPDWHPAVAVPFGAIGALTRLHPEVAGGEDMPGDPWVDLLDLPEFVDRREEDLLLGRVTRPGLPFVMEVQEVTRFFESDWEGVWK